MKPLLSSFLILVLAAALLVLKPFTVSAETFTEGVRVSTETVKLKTGEYVWEPERAPEGPLLIVASTTEVEVTVARKDKSSESLFAAAQKSRLPTEFLAKAKEAITPGATIIFTDKPVDLTTQSATGFQILVAQKDKPSATTE